MVRYECAATLLFLSAFLYYGFPNHSPLPIGPTTSWTLGFPFPLAWPFRCRGQRSGQWTRIRGRGHLYFVESNERQPGEEVERAFNRMHGVAICLSSLVLIFSCNVLAQSVWTGFLVLLDLILEVLSRPLILACLATLGASGVIWALAFSWSFHACYASQACANGLGFHHERKRASV